MDGEETTFCLLINMPTFDHGSNHSENEELLNSNLSH